MKQLDQKARIDAQCIGFSGQIHWAFQWTLFEKLRHLRTLCWLGVYFARDTAYAAHILKQLHGDDYHITAVDRFSDEPCADWPAEKHHLSWEEAGHGPAPTLDAAQKNLRALSLDTHVQLCRQDAITFLEENDTVYDMIYIDTSHDYETTAKTIDRALRRLPSHGILAGDDFDDHPDWGVVPAVRERCPSVRLFGNYIWYAPAFEFTPPSKP